MNVKYTKYINSLRFFLNKETLKRCSLVLCTVFLTFGTLMAQRTVTGNVTDAENGEKLIGATVMVVGTTKGAITDTQGDFRIEVPDNAESLKISFIGYTSKEVSIAGGISTVTVALQSGQDVEELLIIGYSPVSRKKVLGAIASVGEEEIIQNVPTGAFDAVQGRLSGVQILSNGGPGAGFDIRIRGISTFSSGTAPLYVVDGQQLDNIDNIDPNDIKSLEVLKDGATAAIYGSRGANGVVLITTKSGRSEDVKVNITANTAFTDLVGGLPLSNTRQRIEYEDIRRTNTTTSTPIQRDSLSLMNRNSHDLQDLITRIGRRDQVNVAISGGSKKAQIYWNTGFQNEEGIVINSDYQRVNTRLKLKFKPTEKFSLGTNINGSYEEGNGLSENQVFQQMVERIAYFPIIEPNGTYSPEIAGRQNPLAEANLRTIKDRNFRTQIFNFAEYKISPSLSIKSTVGINFRYRKRNYFDPILTRNPNNPVPTGREARNLTYDIQQENFLNYINTFGDHSIIAFGGMQTQRYVLEAFNVRADFISDNVQTFNNIDPETFAIEAGSINQRHNLFSLFAGFNYDFQNKYLVGATVRRDGSSRFGPDNKFGVFPSFTVGWRASNEAFIKDNLSFIDNLLIRFSYGETGNERIGNYEFTSTYLPGYTYNGVSGLAPARLGNSEIGWESTTSTNFGFDLGILDRLTLNFEVWKKETDNLLANVPLPEESGFNSIRQNVGAVENSGIDIGIGGTVLQINEFRWESNFNISFLKNVVTRLNGGIPFQSGDYLIEEGQPLGNIFGFNNMGVYQYDESNAYTPDGERLTPRFFDSGTFEGYLLNGELYTGVVEQMRNAGQILQGGDIIWEDLNGDFDITVVDKQIIGNGLPTMFGGFSNTLTYKSFSLMFLFDYQFGNDIWRRYDETRNDLNSSNETPGPDRIEGAWREQGDITVYPRLTRVAQNRERPNSYFVTKGEFIKLRFVRLNYSLPKSLLGKLGWVDKATFNFSINNPLTWTNYIGYNPELGSRGLPLQPGVDNLRYPNSRSMIAGLRIQF